MFPKNNERALIFPKNKGHDQSLDMEPRLDMDHVPSIYKNLMSTRLDMDGSFFKSGRDHLTLTPRYLKSFTHDLVVKGCLMLKTCNTMQTKTSMSAFAICRSKRERI